MQSEELRRCRTQTFNGFGTGLCEQPQSSICRAYFQYENFCVYQEM
jgi:hypothetical protein